MASSPSPAKGEESAAARLRELLARAYGKRLERDTAWKNCSQVDYAGRVAGGLAAQRILRAALRALPSSPFHLAHLGRPQKRFQRAGELSQAHHTNLEKLTYAYLGDWIRRQQAAVEAGEAGSDADRCARKQLQDEIEARSSKASRPTTSSSAGSHSPSGHRLASRPQRRRAHEHPPLSYGDRRGKKGAGVLRVKPKIGWDKDRGIETVAVKEQFPWFWGWDGRSKDFAGTAILDGIRWNDLHYSRSLRQPLGARRASHERASRTDGPANAAPAPGQQAPRCPTMTLRTRPESLVEGLIGSFGRTLHTPEGTLSPVAILWTDQDAAWRPVVSRLRTELPHLFTLGDYDPQTRTGPTIWLKCIVDRTLPDAPSLMSRRFCTCRE